MDVKGYRDGDGGRDGFGCGFALCNEGYVVCMIRIIKLFGSIYHPLPFFYSSTVITVSARPIPVARVIIVGKGWKILVGMGCMKYGVVLCQAVLLVLEVMIRVFAC